MACKRINVVEVRFLLQGRNQDFSGRLPQWTSLGRLAHPKRGLPIDNVNLFEATWAMRVVRKNVETLESVANLILDKIAKHKSHLAKFARSKGIKPVLYIYIRYKYPDPWIRLSARSITLLCELQSEISMEVVSVSSEYSFKK